MIQIWAGVDDLIRVQIRILLKFAMIISSNLSFFFSVFICFLCKSALCEWIEYQVWLDKWFMHKYLTLINVTKCPWISVKFRIVEIIYAITIKWYDPDIFWVWAYGYLLIGLSKIVATKKHKTSGYGFTQRFATAFIWNRFFKFCIIYK